MIASELDLSKTKGYAVGRTPFSVGDMYLFSDGEHEYFLFLNYKSVWAVQTDWYPPLSKTSETLNDPYLGLSADFMPFTLYTVQDVYKQVAPILAAEARLQDAQERVFRKNKWQQVIWQLKVKEMIGSNK